MASAGSNVRLSLVGITRTTAEILYTIDTTGRYEDGYLIVFNENNTEVSRTSSFRAYGNSSGSQNVTGIASGHLYTVKFYSSDLGVYSESTVEIDLRSGDPVYAISSSSTATSIGIILSPLSGGTMGQDGIVTVEDQNTGEVMGGTKYKSSDSEASVMLVGLEQDTTYQLLVNYYDPGHPGSISKGVAISTSEMGEKQGPSLYGGISGEAEEIAKLYGAPALGKNLSPPITKYTRTGINGSATITASGDTMTVAAAAGGAGPWYRATAANMAVCPYLFQAGNMISFDVVATSSGRIEIGFEGGSWLKYYDIGTTTTRVWVPTQNGGTFHIYSINGGVTFMISNFQVEHGSTATAYEAFEGGETVLLDKLYGGVGKNLFNNEAAPIIKSTLVDKTVLDTGIRITCNANGASGEYYNHCGYILIEASKVAGKKLTLSFDAEGHTQDNKYRVYMGLCRADGTDRASKSALSFSDNGHYSLSWTVVEDEDRPYIIATLYLYSGVVTRTVGEYIDYTNIQLEVGDETTYEPFVGSKLIHVSRPDKVYGYVTYYTDVNHTTTTTEPLKSQTEVNSLAGNSGSWSATVNGETVANSDITGVVLGSLVSTIPDWFLADCDNLTSLEMDKSSVTSIPNRFMSGCTSIADGASVILPPSLTSIGDYFMYGCNGLTSTPVFLDSLTTIGRAFMNNCTNIKAIMLPSSLTSIGQEMLSVCNNLESVYVGSLSADIAAADSSGIYSFSVLTSGVPAYTNGIKILGDSSVIDGWLTKFPNRTSTPFRKLTQSTQTCSMVLTGDDICSVPNLEIFSNKFMSKYPNESPAGFSISKFRLEISGSSIYFYSFFVSGTDQSGVAQPHAELVMGGFIDFITAIDGWGIYYNASILANENMSVRGDIICS